MSAVRRSKRLAQAAANDGSDADTPSVVITQEMTDGKRALRDRSPISRLLPKDVTEADFKTPRSKRNRGVPKLVDEPPPPAPPPTPLKGKRAATEAAVSLNRTTSKSKPPAHPGSLVAAASTPRAAPKSPPRPTRRSARKLKQSIVYNDSSDSAAESDTLFGKEPPAIDKTPSKRAPATSKVSKVRATKQNNSITKVSETSMDKETPKLKETPVAPKNKNKLVEKAMQTPKTPVKQPSSVTASEPKTPEGNETIKSTVDQLRTPETQSNKLSLTPKKSLKTPLKQSNVYDETVNGIEPSASKTASTEHSGTETTGAKSGHKRKLKDTRVSVADVEPKLKSKKKLRQDKRDAGKKKDASKKETESSSDSAVIYLGRIPHGFYEKEMRGYFSQFGFVNRLRLSRCPKSGKSRGYAFIEFLQESVASAAVDAMDGYMMHGQRLKASILPKDKVHADLFKGANRPFTVVDWAARDRKVAVRRANNPIALAKKSRSIEKRYKKRAKRLLEMGVSYKVPTFVNEVKIDRKQPINSA